MRASGRSWRPVAERLAAQARVICPDLLGFGRSPWPDARYTVDDHLAALDATLDRLNLSGEPVILGGHSAGAILALEWVAARPTAFREVALFALPAYRSTAEARAGISRLSALAWATATAPRVGQLVCGLMCATRPAWRVLMPLLSPGVPADAARDFVLHDWASYHETLENVIVHHRVLPAATRLAATGMAVQLLHGARDRQAPLALARELTAGCAWPLTVLADKTHSLPVEAATACAALLETLITAPLPRPSRPE